MADNRICNPTSFSNWRRSIERFRCAAEYKVKEDEDFLRKQKETKKYEGVVNIITNNVLKRQDIQYTYRGLYPIIKEIVESSKYLSSRYSEKDISHITYGVVRKCHCILVIDTEDER